MEYNFAESHGWRSCCVSHQTLRFKTPQLLPLSCSLKLTHSMAGDLAVSADFASFDGAIEELDLLPFCFCLSPQSAYLKLF